MRIASWNINSIKQRMENLCAWLAERSPDIVCLQETECVDETFPREPLEGMGYNVAVHGQKAFNGVAILSKIRIDEARPRLPGDDSDEHARFLEVVISTAGRALRVASLYLPNGNPTNTDRFSYKLKWMDRLFEYASERLQEEEPFILGGDFNVIPTDLDARNQARWVGDALFDPRTREKFRALCNLGLTDAVRAAVEGPGPFTFWDYQAGAWQKNDGIRIDHLVMSPQATDRLTAVGVDKQVRAWEKPSDHVPVWADVELD